MVKICAMFKISLLLVHPDYFYFVLSVFNERAEGKTNVSLRFV